MRTGKWGYEQMQLAKRRLSLALGVAGMLCLFAPTWGHSQTQRPETVTFLSGGRQLSGFLFRPSGPGPFPTVLYNHGSAAGLANNEAFDAIAPVFLVRGWAFFAPYRRGQGLSAAEGPYIMDEIRSARARGGAPAAVEAMTRLLATEHLQDQLAALEWLRKQKFVRPDSIATMGNSFGGVEVLLGAANGGYCAAVDAAGGAESWNDAPELRALMRNAATNATIPILFIQAENDFSTEPSRVLFAARKAAGRPAELRLYAPFGVTAQAGHSFAYRGVEIWREDVVSFLEMACD